MKRGDSVRVTCRGRTLDAKVMLVSDNGYAMMLSFDGALHCDNGGMLLGTAPVLLDDNGQWIIIVDGTPIEITPRSST